MPRTSLDTRGGTPFPHFICEVASDSTWGEDVGEKQRLYADLGTQEYVVFDPNGEFMGEPLRAWRRFPDRSWGRWQPDAEGFLESSVLGGLRLRAEERLLRVYDPQGNRLLTAQELEQLARYQADQLAHQGEQLGEEQARRRALEEENARLREGGR
jgi:Uma2 family endonuclease